MHKILGDPCKGISIQTFDFSTLYTCIRHDFIRSCMNNIISNAFKHKNGAAQGQTDWSIDSGMPHEMCCATVCVLYKTNISNVSFVN